MLWIGKGVGFLSARATLLGIVFLARAGVHAFSTNTLQRGSAEIWAFAEGAESNEICLDTGCSRLLFRIETLSMLSNVREERARAVGIAGQTAGITHTGFCPGKEHLIGKIFCSKDVKLNLMSVPQLMANGCTVIGKGRRLDIFEPSGKILFRGKLNQKGLFVCPLSSLQPSEKDIRLEAHPSSMEADIEGTPKAEVLKGVLEEGHVGTKQEYGHDNDYDLSKMKPGLSDGEFYRFMHGHFTQEERKRAMAAWNLHDAWGHPGKHVMGDALDNGLIAGCVLTRRDLDNAFKMFGPCLPCMEGKFKLPPEPPPDSEPAPTVGHTLNADLFIY